MRRLFVGIIFLYGCYSSSGTTHDARADNGPMDVVQEDRMDTGPDIVPDIIPDGVQCTSPEQCVVALYEDRCCQPDPVAVSIYEAQADHCLHVLGEPWQDHDDCIHILCEMCMEFSDRAYDATCVDGRCVLVQDFCAPMEVPEPVEVLDAGVTPRGGWEQYKGRVVQVYGRPYLGPDSCECCFDCDCICFDHTVQQALECNITLRGSVCGDAFECGGTECEPFCSPEIFYYPFTATGYLVDTEEKGLELWVMEIDEDDCPPPGPNPEGAPCTPFSEENECEEDLFCFYWGDVVWPCAGTCRPFGTECTIDTECAEDEVCYNGYCMWCCPG